ncbi:Protein KRI1-like [Vitis vinifera]|uniref:Protein KRI1-like n=1 Tax=Vitis vinifera TaxID=29760 RepID=A0A438CS17_VITVI|nr:Protein KRI1-like [Vitis vinifera]
MGANLFADVDDDHNDIDTKIEIDEEFARRYEHNKRREDLHRLEELKKKGLAGIGDSDDDESESESSSDADDDESDGDEEDLQFFDALIKVKNQDPSLKQTDTRLFEVKDSDETKAVKGEKSKKAMYLKDVVAKQLIEEGAEYDDEEETEKPKPKSYAEEQEELRRAFLDAAEEVMEDDGGELLSMKENATEKDESGDGEMQKKLDEYFGEDGKLDENSMFLKEYFLNKMWIGDGDTGGGAGDKEAEGVSEDEEEIERQEEYEKKYNFRYEENVGDRVLGHARFVEGSVRKKSNARKAQRESKKERMARAEEERKEELKRLKNLKKREILEKMNKIKEIAGIGENGVLPVNEDDLEGEFDPEEYDRKMKVAFDEDYYNADDADPGFGSDSDEDGGGLEKPDFDKEDELLGLPKNWDVCESGDGFLAAREKILKQKKDVESDSDSEKEEIEPEEDLKTRFKYTTVNPKRFGLSAEEILMMDDTDLNQYVSLKKLAPYREKEWKVPNKKRYEQKTRNKSLLEEAKLNRKKNAGRKKWKGDQKRSALEKDAKQDESAQAEASNGDMGNVSHASRRRRRQAELKLSHSRLMAYGKIPTKPKSKAKH